MNASEWAARFAARKRPNVPRWAQARWLRVVAPIPLNGPVALHRTIPVLPAQASQNAASAVGGSMRGGGGYAASTAPGSQHLATHQGGPQGRQH